MRPDWWRFWDAQAWRDWRVDRDAWARSRSPTIHPADAGTGGAWEDPEGAAIAWEGSGEAADLWEDWGGGEAGEADLAGPLETVRVIPPPPTRPVSPAWGAATAAVLVLAGSVMITRLSSPSDSPPTTVAQPSTTTAAPGTTENLPPQSTTSSSSTTSVATTTPDGGVAAAVVLITDGDTLKVRFEDGTEDTVRLIGVNAPEGGECLADAATTHLTVLLAGQEVILFSDTSDRDQYGRLLRYVWADGIFVNEALVLTGYAIARRYPPDTAQAGLLERAQREAQDNAAGMWQPEACGPGSIQWLDIVDLVADPPGDDTADLNGEFVTITNFGAMPASLDGWSLRDTSSSNRYFFPLGVILLLNESLSVHSGCGQDGPHDLYWCHTGSAIWNNDGDTAYLIDPSGNIHDSFVYPTEEPGDSSPHGFVGTTTPAGCDPSYPTVCIPSPPPDLDCGDIYYRHFSVVGSDPHRFDADSDGVGCESD